jgi:xanthine dehydrogenase accessory factor
MTVPIGPAAEHLQLAGEDYWFCGSGCRTAFAAGKAGV